MIDLFRSDNVVVRSVPTADASRWVVTFDNYGIGHGFERPGFGQDFLLASGISAIHVMGRREDWYQYPEMAEAMAAVRAATVGAERVMTYGSSMGGYAAIRFADAAGASAVLAISPQYSIDPRRAPFERRWLQDSQRIQWLPEIDGSLRCRAVPVIVYDPAGDDRKHVQRIAAEISISPVPLPYSGHPAATFLGDVGLLGEAVYQTLSGAMMADDFRREARRRRRSSTVHHALLATRQPARRQDWGLALSRKALDLAPGNPMAMLALANRLGEAGRNDEAVALHEAATNAAGRDANYLVPYANALQAAGRAQEAVVIAEETIGKQPNSAHLWSWLAFMRWQAGRHEGAVAAIEQAIILHPRYKPYRAALQHYRQGVAAPPQPRGSVVSRWLKAMKKRLSGSSSNSHSLPEAH